MPLQFRMKCVSSNQVREGKNVVYDSLYLVAAASEQPAGVFTGDPRGKLQLQRLSAQPVEKDDEILVTVEAVPKPAPPAEETAEQPAQATAQTADPKPAPTAPENGATSPAKPTAQTTPAK